MNYLGEVARSDEKRFNITKVLVRSLNGGEAWYIRQNICG